MNKVALSNVKDHLLMEAVKCEKQEQKAKEDGMLESYIEMYHDMALLYRNCLEVVSK